jgi:superfamily II DNA or RNA helicase
VAKRNVVTISGYEEVSAYAIAAQEHSVDVADEDTISDFLDEVEMYGDKPVRWYQIAARNQVEDALVSGVKRILVVLPTGAGKTITSGLIFTSGRIRKHLKIRPNRKLRLLFIAHKHRLLTQAERAYADAMNVEFIPHSAFQELPADVKWDIACIDEAHHEAMMSIQLQLDRIGTKPIIGLTATPDRADGCVIKFEVIVNPISREQAVAEGYLAKTVLNSIVDSANPDKTEVTKMVIDYFGKEFGQTMMFFRTKKEVVAITAYLNEKGYKAIAVQDQSEQELDRILDDFSDGKFQFIVNCNKINEGVDVKGCTDVYLGRAYGSYPQLNQVIGRAARPDSDCRVWELVNPLSGRNLDTTVVVGTPERHRLIHKARGKWIEQDFDYTSSRIGGNSGLIPTKSRDNAGNRFHSDRVDDSE